MSSFIGSGHYQCLVDCLDHDWVMIWLVVLLSSGVIFSFMWIAWQWHQDSRSLLKGPAKSSLIYLRSMFVVCGACGYGFVLLKMFWPAWWLNVFGLVVLNYYSWTFACRGGLKLVYMDLKSASSELEMKAMVNAIPNQLAWIAEADGWITWYNNQWYLYTVYEE